MSYFTALLNYLKGSNPLRVIINGLVVLIVTTWLGFGYLFLAHPTQITSIISHVDRIDLKATTRMSVHLDEQLDYALSLTGSDRASINKFHDGKTDTQGLHFLFSSRTNELASRGAASELLLTQNIPLSFLSDTIPHFIKHECAVVNIQTGTSSAHDWYKQQGISYLIACPIFSGQDLTAFLELDWVSSSPPPAGYKTGPVEAIASRIEGIMTSAN
jgi:hypothetical protein